MIEANLTSTKSIPLQPQAKLKFHSAAAAWFWTMTYRGEERSPFERQKHPTPCEPRDVVHCLGELYATRVLHPRHAAVLRQGGLNRKAPVKGQAPQAQLELWAEAMEALNEAFKKKGWL